MKAMLIIWGVIALLLLGALLAVFSFFVFPIWAVVYCATSKASTTTKVIWTVLMLLIWPIAAIVYAFVESKKRSLKWAAAFSVGFFIVLALIFTIAMPYAIKQGQKQAKKALAEINQLTAVTLSQENLGKLKDVLELLQQEMNAPTRWVNGYKVKVGIINLLELFDLLIEDKVLTEAEYQDWIEKYNSRHLLDQGALKEHIRELKRKQLESSI